MSIPNWKVEQFVRIVTCCPRQGSSLSPCIFILACLPLHHRAKECPVLCSSPLPQLYCHISAYPTSHFTHLCLSLRNSLEQFSLSHPMPFCFKLIYLYLDITVLYFYHKPKPLHSFVFHLWHHSVNALFRFPFFITHCHCPLCSTCFIHVLLFSLHTKLSTSIHDFRITVSWYQMIDLFVINCLISLLL